MPIIANHILREILHEVREAGTFALLADEASDVSLKEQLCTSIRWMDDNLAQCKGQDDGWSRYPCTRA